VGATASAYTTVDKSCQGELEGPTSKYDLTYLREGRWDEP
jgi:hypothetical protein